MKKLAAIAALFVGGAMFVSAQDATVTTETNVAAETTVQQTEPAQPGTKPAPIKAMIKAKAQAGADMKVGSTTKPGMGNSENAAKIRALHAEMQAKIKAIHEEYRVKFKALGIDLPAPVIQAIEAKAGVSAGMGIKASTTPQQKAKAAAGLLKIRAEANANGEVKGATTDGEGAVMNFFRGLFGGQQ